MVGTFPIDVDLLSCKPCPEALQAWDKTSAIDAFLSTPAKKYTTRIVGRPFSAATVVVQRPSLLCFVGPTDWHESLRTETFWEDVEKETQLRGDPSAATSLSSDSPVGIAHQTDVEL